MLKFLVLSLSVGLLLALPAQAESKLENRSVTLPKQLVFQEDFIPPENGTPKDTSSGGSRDGLRCSQNEQSIQPLMPKRNYGLTLEERPAIFVYIPETSARKIVLAFRSETGEFYERAFLPITTRAGIVSFTLPERESPLAVGKNYQWSLVVVCGETVQPDDPVVRGWVQRVARSPQIESELRQKTAIEQAMWYYANGYWYDLLKVMTQARQLHPNDAKLTVLWRDLLGTIGLSAIASEPLL